MTDFSALNLSSTPRRVTPSGGAAAPLEQLGDSSFPRFLNARLLDLCLALAVVGIMTAVSWGLAGAPGTNGIDDAAITRSYSENLAGGHGFVYNIGGERVEGATSLLWTLLLALPYLGGAPPELAILMVTALLTVAAVYFALRIARRAAGDSTVGGAAAGLSALALCGLPSFFIWSVWSMMEIALWTGLCLLLLERLSRLTEAQGPPAVWDLPLVLAASALPLTRPEGIAVAAGLLGLAAVLRPAIWRAVGLAMAASVAAFGALAVGRLAYFGFPFPNTYYAKVSADRLQNITDGGKYFLSFLTEQPFAEVLIPAWLLLLALSLWGLLRRPMRGQRTVVLAAALVFGLLFSYVMLGGDHFALWRFYQPVMPLFALPLVLGGLALWRRLQPGPWTGAGLALVVLLVWGGVNAVFYRQERFAIGREFTLSARGETFGRYMNGFVPQPVMGVTAAGGIALTYEGELRDLMGLNWVEMAHANPIKTGMRNHASFDVATFWKYPPDLLPQFHKTTCRRSGWSEASKTADQGVKQLYSQARFQREYTPILLEMGGGACTNAFAANRWLAQVSDSRITLLSWQDVTLVAAH